MGKGFAAGIDSGSTSTDVVILDKDKHMVTGIILPTGAGAAIGAERALEQALDSAGLTREDIDALVTTGYGRTAIESGSCHYESSGAHGLGGYVCVGAVVRGDVAFQLCEQGGLGGDVVRYGAVDNDIKIAR